MRTRIVLAAAVLMVGGAALYLGQRAATATIATHVGPQQIEAECSGWTGVTDRCGEWGEAVLASGAPSTTFRLEDVVRVRMNRPTFGLADTCTVDYFIGRYPEEVAWTEEIDCFEG